MRAGVALFVALLFVPFPGAAQAEEAPPLVEGPNRLYAHASPDSMRVWMNTLQDDGNTPYNVFGAPATPVVQGLSADPVIVETFAVRIPMTPGLEQDVVLSGTVNVQAYIGGGVATAGRATIATSLAVDGKTIRAAPAKEHIMTPQAQAGTTYNPISWTMTLDDVAIAAGSLVEWVISGTVQAGNNIYMGAHAGRGRSYIELPVASIGGAAGASSLYGDVPFPAQVDHSFAEPTSDTYVLNWTSPGGDLTSTIAINGTGAMAIEYAVEGGSIFNATFDGVGQENITLQDVPAGNGTITIRYTAFAGDMALRLAVLETGPDDGPVDEGGSEAPDGADGTDTQTPEDNGTVDGGGKDTPLPWMAPVLGLLVAVAVRRRI